MLRSNDVLARRQPNDFLVQLDRIDAVPATLRTRVVPVDLARPGDLVATAHAIASPPDALQPALPVSRLLAPFLKTTFPRSDRKSSGRICHARVDVLHHDIHTMLDC